MYACRLGVASAMAYVSTQSKVGPAITELRKVLLEHSTAPTAASLGSILQCPISPDWIDKHLDAAFRFVGV